MEKDKFGSDFKNQKALETSVSDVHVDLNADIVHAKKAPVKFTKGKLIVLVSILLCELCERLTYYSVYANMVLFCTSKLLYTKPEATYINNVFAGVVYFIPLFGGYIADAYSGRYNAIFGAGTIYLIGLVMLPAAAIDYASFFGTDEEGMPIDMSLEARRIFFMLGLVFIAIGTGGIKANVSPFGALQIEDMGKDAVRSFFNWFYWFVNAGSLIAHSSVTYVQQNVSLAWGFTIPLFSMILSLLIFAAARSRYIHKPPGESVLATILNVYRKGCRGFDKVRKKHGGPYDDETVDGAISILRILPVYLFIVLYWTIYTHS